MLRPLLREASKQTPMFGRGRLDHIGLHAASLDDFAEIRTRLMNEGATDGTVTCLDGRDANGS